MQRIRFPLLAIGSFGVVVGIAVREAAWESTHELRTPNTEAVQPPARKIPSPEEIARPHLSWAEKQAADALDEHLRPIRAFFVDAKRDTPKFAERALSFGSKWRLVADHVPFTRGGRHAAFLRTQFEEHLFTPAQMAQIVEQAVTGYVTHIRSIESEMLVKLRADLADFPEAYLAAGLDEAALRARYDEALSQALAATQSDFRSDVATQVVSLISGEVLTQVAVRLGVSAGVLGTGAASSWATFGIGLVVGVIVDQIVSWVWDWYADPKGNLAIQLNAKLDGLSRLIVDGSDGVEGLRLRLTNYAEQRTKLREVAVLAVLDTH